MSRKRHKPEEIIAKLRQVEVMTSQDAAMAEAIRSIGVTEVTYYRWRSEYGGMKLDQVKRRKCAENRLRAAGVDQDRNVAGVTGGVRLWETELDELFMGEPKAQRGALPEGSQ